jgi:hypothetical protein
MHQHCALLVLREKEHKSYRDFVDWLYECEALCAFIGLRRIPHFTTLQKSAQRIQTTALYGVIAAFLLFTQVRKLFLGVDGTGFSLRHASAYYVDRIERSKKHRRRRKRKVKHYLKTVTGIELRKQLIVSQKLRRGPANDYSDFAPVARKAGKIRPLQIVVADKGSDSEENHRIVHEELHADCIIPPRNEDVPVWRTQGYYRKHMKRGYDKKKYNQRAKCETVFSVVKRKFGDTVSAKHVATQNKQLLFRFIAYNAHRICAYFLFVSEGFYKATKHVK